MFKYIFFIIFLFINFNVLSNDNLTVQQQLERLQREVSDLSKSVFSKNNNTNNNETISNLSAIDMRIYDLEKDMKNLNANLEEIFFKIEDIFLKIDELESSISSLDKNVKNIKIDSPADSDTSSLDIDEQIENSVNENSLGSLKISQGNENEIKNEGSEEVQNTIEKLSPEDQFQLAFDHIRNKKWEDAKKSFKKFIEDNPGNQISGSAHYWLGELYILEKKYRDAALVFAEGYQKFPKSIKAPDLLFKLSQSLVEVDRKEEACKTIEKLIDDYPTNKLVKQANDLFISYGCNNANQ